MTDEEWGAECKRCNESFEFWLKKNQESYGQLWLNNILSDAYFAGYEAGLKDKEQMK